MFEENLDAFEFINSKDIKEHLKNLNYKFNSLEVAWLIYQCKHISIDEKHKAFRQLIDTMPDCEIPERTNTVYKPSLHAYLKEYIIAENDLLNRFIKDNRNCFFEWFHYDTNSGGWLPSDKCHYTFEECFKNAIWFNTEYGLERFGCEKFKVTKREIGNIYSVEVLFILEKVYSYTINGDIYDNHKVLHEVFDGLWFDFPTPFKKGDILCEYNIDGSETAGFCKGPFVMTAITPEKTNRWARKSGDVSDMNAWGYFIDDNGKIYSEVMWNYMDLEFYHGNLNSKKRILKALSNFVLGEIDIALFSNAYHYVLFEELAKDNKPQGYIREGLSLAGVEN